MLFWYILFKCCSLLIQRIVLIYIIILPWLWIDFFSHILSPSLTHTPTHALAVCAFLWKKKKRDTACIVQYAFGWKWSKDRHQGTLKSMIDSNLWHELTRTFSYFHNCLFLISQYFRLKEEEEKNWVKTQWKNELGNRNEKCICIRFIWAEQLLLHGQVHKCIPFSLSHRHRNFIRYFSYCALP